MKASHLKKSVLFLGLCSILLMVAGFGTGKKSEQPSASIEKAAPPESVWIARSEGSLQCEPDSGKKIEATVAELKAAGIAVLESRASDDGKMRAQMCGMPTGKRHEVRVERGSLARAKELGFAESKE